MKRITIDTRSRLHGANACRGTRVILATFAAVTATMLTGCGKSDRVDVYPTEGRILCNGKPLAGALVVLYPQGQPDAPVTPRGQTDSDGRYTLGTYSAGDGAPEGQYAVTVLHYPMQQQNGGWTAAANALPKKYASPTTTSLRAQIARGSNSLAPLVVKR